jgi:hypothetical protein
MPVACDFGPRVLTWPQWPPGLPRSGLCCPPGRRQWVGASDRPPCPPACPICPAGGLGGRFRPPFVAPFAGVRVIMPPGAAWRRAEGQGVRARAPMGPWPGARPARGEFPPAGPPGAHRDPRPAASIIGLQVASSAPGPRFAGYRLRPDFNGGVRTLRPWAAPRRRLRLMMWRCHTAAAHWPQPEPFCRARNKLRPRSGARSGRDWQGP